jgi:hypothetical protein
VKAVRRDSWAPSTRSVLCSVHFAEECFDRTFCNITKLHRDAVPTIFPAFPAHLQKPTAPKRRLVIRKLSSLPPPLSNIPEFSEEPVPSTSTDIKETEQPVEDVALTSLSIRQLLSKTTSFSPDRKHR